MSEQIHKRQGANLPHWTRDGAIYFVTFRTADSLPAEAVERLRSETRLIEGKANWQELSFEDLARLSVLKSEAYLRILDNCYGACVLRRDDCAALVAETLLNRAEVEYRLWAWCVMPNHVHAVIEPFAGILLSKVLRAWKSISSRKIGRLLGASGTFWQSESFDHLIRDEDEFQHYVDYTLHNPEQAGLKNWRWLGTC